MRTLGFLSILLAMFSVCVVLNAQQALPAQQAPPAQPAPPAQQAPPVQPYPVLRTERVGTAPPPAQIFKVFQFPADKIPRIDGDDSDWAIVPQSYSIGLDQMHDDEHKHDKPDPKDLDIHVKVGWVKGLNRLISCMKPMTITGTLRTPASITTPSRLSWMETVPAGR